MLMLDLIDIQEENVAGKTKIQLDLLQTLIDVFPLFFFPLHTALLVVNILLGDACK